MGIRSDKDTYNAYMREYNKKNPQKRKHGDLKKKFGMSYADYEQMFTQQQGVCKVCYQAETQCHPITQTPYMLSVDHCHTTGKIRGLLCNRCNRVLGMVNDNKDILSGLIKYLDGSV